ncbi:MAG: HAMP domain-containing histidine kinase, partial [Actinobacteria bacterium]|nr:HAMP domain-containing histidine kinase [Actinomycetota bacterium]
LVAVAFAVPLALLARNVARDRALTAAERDVAALAPVLALTSDADLIGAAIARTGTGAAGRVTVWTDRGQIGDPVPADPAQFDLARQRRLAFSARGRGETEIFQPVVTGTGAVAVVRARVPDRALTRGVRSAWVSLAVVAAGLVAGAVLIADRLGRGVTRPARQLAAVARRLGHGELRARAAGGGPPEIADAAQALNFLAGRIQVLLDAERERVADLSHRLRTPLTALRLDAEVADAPALVHGVDRLQQAVTDLIAAARRPLATEPSSGCDVAALARQRAEYWGALADEQARPWEFRATGPGPWVVDLLADDASAAIDALVGNIFNHTPDGTAYRVTVESDGTVVVVAVDDAGPGISDPAAVVERGHSSAGSSGLGLDIAHRSVEAAGGRLELERSPLGGARVALRFPLTRGEFPAPPD